MTVINNYRLVAKNYSVLNALLSTSLLNVVNVIGYIYRYIEIFESTMLEANATIQRQMEINRK